MIYLIYLILVPISLLITLVALVLNPVLPLFASNQEGWCDNHSYWNVGPRLPKWLNWFQTPDNDLYGDGTFRAINGASYWSMVKWLYRNPAYSFAIKYLYTPYTTSVIGDNTIKDNDHAKEGYCFIRANGLFLFRVVIRIFSTNRCFYANFGWNIAGLVDPNVTAGSPWQATFVFSPRISGFR